MHFGLGTGLFTLTSPPPAVDHQTVQGEGLQ